MKINAVISNLNAWEYLKESKAQILAEIEEVIADNQADLLNRRKEVPVPRASLRSKMQGLGWSKLEYNIPSRKGTGSMPFYLDYLKDGVGLVVFIGKRTYLESLLFVQLQSWAQ